LSYNVDMNIEFFFDPSCPFCWITSRWLHVVSGERDLQIEWRPFSLAIKNNELDEKNSSDYSETHKQAHRILRVIQAATKHGAAHGDLYTLFGVHHHVAGRPYDDELIKEIISDQNLPAGLLKEADNAQHDAAIEEHMDQALEVTGDDVGVPIIVFRDESGNRTGYFGPVLQTLPNKEDALKLWDGLSQLATNSNFYELKRTRPKDGPDTASTARC